MAHNWRTKISAIPDIVWSPIISGILMVIPGVLSITMHQPWLFPSLGPTAFLQAQAPRLQMSRLYNTIVGHSIGIIAGYISVFMLGLGASNATAVMHHLTAGRMWASVIAVTLTLLGQIPLRATHAPAAATTLLISLGGFARKWLEVENLFVGILIVALAGEFFRWLRTPQDATSEHPST